ncbi:MAG: Cof-type HAD-IIB family hydrolase [Clostridia bacterium]|nr:Cof-type HAD-IIB family hydrolase [Clostridia bacterium]
MKYKLIVSDFDGTLAYKYVVSQPVVDAIKKYRNQGGKFVLCTGRHRLSARAVIKSNGFETDGVVSLQGAYAETNGVEIVNGGIDKKIVYEIVNFIHTFGVKVCLWQDDNLYYEDDKTCVEYAGYFGAVGVTAKPINNVNEILTNNVKVYNKIIVSKTPIDVFDKIISLVNEKFGAEVVANSGAPQLVEIVSNKFTKYASTKKLVEYLGFNENEVITVGDSTNDLTLLQYGFSIAVDNAEEEVKKVASYIAPSVQNDAMKFIIEKILAGEDFT